MGVPPDSRDVQVRVPARPGYLVVARLALSAICRMTPLEHADVADLKLAVTEAAAGFVSDDGGERRLALTIRLQDDRIELELRGTPVGAPEEELALSRAIVEATVDEATVEPDHALLTKRLAA